MTDRTSALSEGLPNDGRYRTGRDAKTAMKGAIYGFDYFLNSIDDQKLSHFASLQASRHGRT